MPSRIGAFDNEITGYLGFCAVKFVGYSIAARVISRFFYPNVTRGAFTIGGARTLIGMISGAGYYGLYQAKGAMMLGYGPQSYWAGLFPVRFLEWCFLIWLFYDRKFENKPKFCRVALLGTAWSYVCDIPAVIGYFMTGGVFVIC